MRYVRQFGSFLYDFLVGDAWELFLGPIAAVIIAGVVLGVVGATAAGALLFVMVLVVAGVNLTLALRGSA